MDDKAREIFEKVNGMTGWLKDEELIGLIETSLKTRPGNIVEVGTGLGKSTAVLALGNPDCHVYTIDNMTAKFHQNMKVEDFEEMCFSAWKGLGIEERITFKVGDFRDWDWHGEIELLFIEGKQTYMEALDTFQKFSPYIRSGGYLVIRDYLTRAADHEHGKFVDEILSKDPRFETHIQGQYVWARRLLTYDEINEKTQDIVSFDMKPDDTLAYLKYIRPLAPGSKVVDFGTGEAKNAIRMALANPDAEVWTWDWGTGNPDGHAPTYFRRIHNLLRKKKVDNIYFSTALSSEAWPTWDWLIDVLNIDASHDYEETLKDIKRWEPFVKDGGYIFVHDYNYPGSAPYKFDGLRQAIAETLTDYEPIDYLGGTQVFKKKDKK